MSTLVRRWPALVYTGGTTGVPKAAMLSHLKLVANAMQASVWVGLQDSKEAILSALVNRSPLTPRFHLESVRACVSGGAPLPQAVAHRFERITHGAKLVEGYGLTEASPPTHANPIDGSGKPGTIGLPVPDTDCRIIDLRDPDTEVPPGDRGELCVRGPQVMLGYWGHPEETARTINGWLHTGDDISEGWLSGAGK
jgi:long-subunit acyl-CoA synthetase (AMP-forming)